MQKNTEQENTNENSNFKNIFATVFLRAFINILIGLLLLYTIYLLEQQDITIIVVSMLTVMATILEFGLVQQFVLHDRPHRDESFHKIHGHINVMPYTEFYTRIVYSSLIWIAIGIWFLITNTSAYFGNIGGNTVFLFSIQFILNMLVAVYFLSTKSHWQQKKIFRKQAKTKAK